MRSWGRGKPVITKGETEYDRRGPYNRGTSKTLCRPIKLSSEKLDRRQTNLVGRCFISVPKQGGKRNRRWVYSLLSFPEGTYFVVVTRVGVKMKRKEVV